MRSASRADFARLSLTSLAFSESYLIGRVHCSAKRTPKTHYFLRQPTLDALRWHLSAAPFFDSHRFQKCSGNGRPFEPAQQSLQCGRVVAGDSLSHHPRPRTHRDHAVAATQWGLSISERIVDLSQSQHPQTIPAAHGTPSPAQVAQASRSVPGKDGQQAPSTLASYLRRGFHSPCGLRKTRRGEGWLQPDQAWTAIVSPFALFRRTDEGLLAWGASSRRCSHFQRCTGTPRGVLCQDPVGVRAVLVRADKGFYDHKVIEWLEERKARFVIVARITKPIKRKLTHQRYTSVSHCVEAAEFYYQPTRWLRPYRF